MKKPEDVFRELGRLYEFNKRLRGFSLVGEALPAADKEASRTEKQEGAKAPLEHSPKSNRPKKIV